MRNSGPIAVQFQIVRTRKRGPNSLCFYLSAVTHTRGEQWPVYFARSELTAVARHIFDVLSAIRVRGTWLQRMSASQTGTLSNVCNSGHAVGKKWLQ